jgi:hypothetical protein
VVILLYGNCLLNLPLCFLQAIKSIERIGLDAMAAEAGIDLWKLPFEDARPERLAYLAENKGKVPVVSAWSNLSQTLVKHWRMKSQSVACKVQHSTGSLVKAEITSRCFPACFSSCCM